MLVLKNRKIYLTLLGCYAALFALRAYTDTVPLFLALHLSNFSITGGLYLLSDYGSLMRKGFTRKSLLLNMLPFALLNVVMELFVRADTIKIGIVEFVQFNTPDPVDMLFGLASLALIYFIAARFAVQLSEPSPKK